MKRVLGLHVELAKLESQVPQVRAEQLMASTEYSATTSSRSEAAPTSVPRRASREAPRLEFRLS
jgi:hypothetical protein